MADLITHLVTHGIVGFLAMDTAVQHMRKVGGRLSSSILETADIEPLVLLESISKFHGLEYASDELLLSIDPDVPQFWRHDNALRLGAIPLALDASGLTLGVLEPLSQFHLEEVKEEYGSNIRQLLLLEFRFFELCNRFFDVVLEQRYAIWASKFPLQETPLAETSAALLPDEEEDDADALFHAADPSAPADEDDRAREQTTESTDTVDDHTLETDRTDADEDDNLPPLLDDVDTILTGPRDAMDLLGSDDSFEAAFASSDDALFLVDPAAQAPDGSDTHDIPTLREHTPAHTPPLPSEDLALEEPSTARRGKEPSMPAIRIGPHDSQPRIRASASLHTPSRIETTDAQEQDDLEASAYHGREPFPSPKTATQVSGTFRIGYPPQRNADDAFAANPETATALGFTDDNGSWKQTHQTMDALSEQESSYARTISSIDIRGIYQRATRVDELLYPTLTYFGAFFERRFLMHFWKSSRSAGLLMQGVREHHSPFSRIEVPYDESSGVHKMRTTGNYLQGSPIDIGFLTLYTRLGIPTAKEAIAMPIYVDKEVVMMLLMDNGPDRPLDDTLLASEIALLLQQLGRALENLTHQNDHRINQPTPIDGEVAAPSTEDASPFDRDAPLIPPELLDDMELPPAASDDLEIEMDSMQMDPVDTDEDDELTLDSIEEFFGPKFQPTSTKKTDTTTDGSDSFEIAISTDQELSPAAKALLEQDTRRDDKRAVSIIVGDDERSDADIAYDLIPPTPSDLIRPPKPEEDSGVHRVDRVSRTTARHHALSGHNQYADKESTPHDTPAASATSAPDTQSKRAQWNARDLARLLRVGSTEFPLPETNKKTAHSDTDTEKTHPKVQDTAEQDTDQKLQDTAEQEADQKLQDTAEQEADQKLQDTAEQEADQKLQDTAEQAADQKLQDTAEQEADQKLQDTAEQEAAKPLADTKEQEAAPDAHDDEPHATEAFSLNLSPDLPASNEHVSPQDSADTSSDDPEKLHDKEAQAPVIAATPALSNAPEDPTPSPSTASAHQQGTRVATRTKIQATQRSAPLVETDLPDDAPPSEAAVKANPPHDAAPQDDAAPATPSIDDQAAEQLRKILQERQEAKARERQHAKTRLESTLESTETRIETDTPDSSESEAHGTSMFSPTPQIAGRRTQKTHVVAPRALPAEEIATVSEPITVPGTSTSKEIDLDAVLNEVDQTAAPANVDTLAEQVAQKLPSADTGAAASLVRLVELTENQRRMGTSAIRPLSLTMETLLRGAQEDRANALQELLKTPLDELPDIHSEFPGPLTLDRHNPEDAARPLNEHGPLLALVDARLYDFVPQLWACLERRSADARYYALRFLSLIRNLERRFVLVEAALDADAQIRDLAVRNIETFRNSPDFLLALETFRDRLQEDDPTLRAAAIEALVKLRDHDAIPALIERLRDPDETVRQQAHQGLKRLTFVDLGATPEAWEQWRALHGRELPEQWLVDAMDAVEPVRRALAARALENLSGLVINYHPDMSQQGLLRAKMAAERHFGLRR